MSMKSRDAARENRARSLSQRGREDAEVVQRWHGIDRRGVEPEVDLRAVCAIGHEELGESIVSDRDVDRQTVRGQCFDCWIDERVDGVGRRAEAVEVFGAAVDHFVDDESCASGKCEVSRLGDGE
jgi:hypothetical protein